MAIIRNLKRQLINMIGITKTYTIFYLGLLMYLSMFRGIHNFEYYQTKINPLTIILFGIIVMWSLSFPMQFQISGFRDAINFSVTRKSFYIANQIFKIILSIFTLALYLIFNVALTKMFSYNGFFKEAINFSFLIFSSVLLASTLAELFGNIVNLSGKPLIFTVLNIMVSSIFMLAIIFSFKDREITYFYNPYINFIILLLSILISIVNWFLIKKCSFK